MLFLNKQNKQSKKRAITGRPYVYDLEIWLSHKMRSLTKSQSEFIKKVGDIIGNYNQVDVDLDQDAFNIYFTVTPRIRSLIDDAFRFANSIMIDTPDDNYPNIVKITLDVRR